jgi:hypothetical protein
MEKWKIDVPVYLNFFNRPETFKLVFDAIREAKPSKLFLACDGPRIGREDDKINVEKCKEIAENIDWECEVHKNYSKINLGCGMRMNTGISWAFEFVDRVLIFEDDCVPSQDFFPFCEELLEKYKNDDRIHMINAMNHLIKYEETPYSYFFGPGCCWGWATWKRAWRQMNFKMTFLEDIYSMKCVERKYPFYKNAYSEGMEKLSVLNSKKRLSSWTYQSGMASALYSQMAIVPSVNMITNIGLTADSTHAVNNLKKLSKKTQSYFNAPLIPMQFPLNHPTYIVEDWNYYDLVQKKFQATITSTIEGYVRRIIFAEKGDFKIILKKIKKKIKYNKKGNY